MNKRTMLTAAAIVAVGCIAIPTGAYAANGGAWLLGRSNSETATTTVTNNYGTPLSLNAKLGYAPFKVNRTTKVTYLNSDLVDGYSATSFAMRSAKTGVVYHDGYIDGMGAKCPAGTIIAGGGGYDPMGWNIGYSGPDWNSSGTLIANSWIVLDNEGGPMVSFANCINLSGAAVPGAMTSTSQFPGAGAAAAQGLGSVPDSLMQMRAKADGKTKVAK